ncbi:PREDICTED: pentatricopeptide repeat-containing protein At2g37310 [Nelumbo nucifera]|uniref:Pentatricopeptide repeat-containing protein At2g37310 n=1 Tax=Nelumbo nucifera TaxID=4432 RepID=A0A1U8BCW1_NELNU|nr:PREDICTED: pentatricopeptide repeat-containing protein At2g37310 [Nelumbo nucifera]
MIPDRYLETHFKTLTQTKKNPCRPNLFQLPTQKGITHVPCVPTAHYNRASVISSLLSVSPLILNPDAVRVQCSFGSVVRNKSNLSPISIRGAHKQIRVRHGHICETKVEICSSIHVSIQAAGLMKITKPFNIKISTTTDSTIERALASLYQVHFLDYGACGHLIQHFTNHHLVRQGKQIHARLILTSVIPDNFLASKLLTFYSKSGSLYEAYKVFDKIPNKNIFSWNAMFIAYSLHNRHSETLKLFSSLVASSTGTVKPDNFTVTSVLKALSCLFPDSRLAKEIHNFVLRHGYESDLFVVNALITIYARSSNLGLARKLFDWIPDRDIVSWNSMLAGYSQAGFYEDCLRLYREMENCTYLKPNEVTVVSVLQACAQLKDLNFGMEIHRFIIENKVKVDMSVCNSIIGLYAKCGSLNYARELFDEMTERDDISYGSMISGYMLHGFVNKALELFEGIEKPGLNTWNAMISGLVQNNHHEGVPELLRKLQTAGLRPNSVTLASVLPTFSYFSNLKGGKQIHCYAIRNGFDQNIFVGTAIIDTYAKAGFLHAAHQVFVQLGSKSVIVWTAIISAYAAHGDANAALRLFHEMITGGILPDPVTFTAVLAACAHAGLVDEAWQIFNTMLPEYRIQPTIEHYACMVGVISRAGMLSEAVQFISKMPIEPNAKVWGVLLNGAAVSGDVDLGKFVCDQLFEIEPENTGNYIILANLYSQAGRWEEAERVREKMKKMGLKKVPGCSWIETSCGLQSFVAGYVSDHSTKEIYEILEGMVELMKEEGYVPANDLDEDSFYS